MDKQTESTTSNQMTQGAAVIQAVRDVLKSDYKEGVKVVLTDDQRKAVTEILVKGFTERRIALKDSPANEAKRKDPKLLNSYCRGLLQNWLTKSPALNGKPAKVKATPAPKPAGAQTPEVVPTTPVVQPKVDIETPAAPAVKKPLFGKK